MDEQIGNLSKGARLRTLVPRFFALQEAGIALEAFFKEQKVSKCRSVCGWIIRLCRWRTWPRRHQSLASLHDLGLGMLFRLDASSPLCDQNVVCLPAFSIFPNTAQPVLVVVGDKSVGRWWRRCKPRNHIRKADKKLMRLSLGKLLNDPPWGADDLISAHRSIDGNAHLSGRKLGPHLRRFSAYVIQFQ